MRTTPSLEGSTVCGKNEEEGELGRSRGSRRERDERTHVSEPDSKEGDSKDENVPEEVKSNT